MRLKKIVEPEDAVAVVRDGDVIATSGYAGSGTPDQLLVALEKRFLETGAPRGLTVVHSTGQGDARDKGLNRIGHAGLIRRFIGGHFGLMPRVEKLIVEERIEAYNFPEGVITNLYRDIGAGKPGTITRVGVGTFVDPRFGGGKLNALTTEDLVERLSVRGTEHLFFKAFPINVALIRGTTGDPDGNITTERESLALENLALAIAAKNSGGIVLAQVERVAAEGSLDPRDVRVPGVLVDCVVVAEPEHHMQTYGTQYNPAFSGEVRVPLQALAPLEMGERKIIARRAALKLEPNSVINVGIGMPDGVPRVASEERIQDLITLTVDPGVMGGVPMGGLDFGVAVNYQAVIDHCSAFDFVDGGGLDQVFLGFGECDARGNVNASRFGNKVPGCGGFINLSQNSKKVVFLGTFTSGGFEAKVADGKLVILREGKHSKFVPEVGQITFSGVEAARRRQPVLYVTERCVFRLTPDGLELTEIAPGIDLERDILARMPFRPLVRSPKLMESAIFGPEPMGLRSRLLDIRFEERLQYDAASNTIYIDLHAMRVRTREDVQHIREVVDRVLGSIGKRMYAIVNYERFECDVDVVAAYMDLVKHVQDSYYISVKRYTSSAFLRHKLGTELGERRSLPFEVFGSVHEAESGAQQ